MHPAILFCQQAEQFCARTKDTMLLWPCGTRDHQGQVAVLEGLRALSEEPWRPSGARDQI